MRKVWFTVVLVSVWVGEASPWEEITVDRFSGLGARAMGMGGAYVAVAEDFTATYWNPAGLAQIRRFELYGGLCQRQDAATVSFYGSPWHDSLTRTTSDPLGMVLPVPTYRGSLVFSVGYLPVKVFDDLFGVKGVSRESGRYKEGRAEDEGGLGVYTVAGAIDISPSTSLGATLEIWRGSDSFSQELFSRSLTSAAWGEIKQGLGSPQDTSVSYYKLEFEDRYSSFGVKVGALFRMVGGFRAGLAVSSPVHLKVEEDWEEARDDTVDSGSFSYHVHLPWTIDGGISWTAPGLATVGVGISYSDWTQTRYDEPPVEGITNEDFRRRYRATTRLHVGGEVLLPIIPVRVRGGYYRDPIPFLGPREEGGPKVEVKDRRDYWTFGVGVLIDKVLSLDLAYVRGKFAQEEGGITEEHKLTRIFLSAAYRF